MFLADSIECNGLQFNKSVQGNGGGGGGGQCDGSSNDRQRRDLVYCFFVLFCFVFGKCRSSIKVTDRLIFWFGFCLLFAS